MYTNKILPSFDFSPIAGKQTEQIIQDSIDRYRNRVKPIQQYFPEPMLPEPGGSETELDEMESALGIPLPVGYREFLRRVRYAVLDDGIQVWGLDHNGISYGRPWLSDDHKPGARFLVFGHYWRYADGDQLLTPVDTEDQSVVCYLHEHGPLFEIFAPSFPAALWRIGFEETDA